MQTKFLSLLCILGFWGFGTAASAQNFQATFSPSGYYTVTVGNGSFSYSQTDPVIPYYRNRGVWGGHYSFPQPVYAPSRAYAPAVIVAPRVNVYPSRPNYGGRR